MYINKICPKNSCSRLCELKYVYTLSYTTHLSIHSSSHWLLSATHTRPGSDAENSETQMRFQGWLWRRGSRIRLTQLGQSHSAFCSEWGHAGVVFFYCIWAVPAVSNCALLDPLWFPVEGSLFPPAWPASFSEESILWNKKIKDKFNLM